MEQFLIIIIFLMSIVVLRLTGFRFFSINAHPLSLLIIIQVFMLTVVGTVALGIFDMPMSYGVDQYITSATRNEVIFLTFSSLAFLFLGLTILSLLKIIQTFEYVVNESDIYLLKRLTYISAAILTLKLLSVSDIPLLLIIKGDVQAAAEAKVKILTNQTGITIFGLNYIIRSFTSYIFIASAFMYAYAKQNKLIRNIFLFNIMLALINALYDVQKQAVVLLALLTFWIFYTRKGEIQFLIKGAFLAVGLSTLMFIVTLGSKFDFSVINDVFQRVFLGQSEGMFFIRQYINPSSNYAWLGFPLAGMLNLPQIDPAAQVIKTLFPGAGDSWLNSNTYYIAHAWSIFGDSAIFFGPMFVIFNIALLLLIGQYFINKKSTIFYPIVFWFIVKMPLANIFTEFLWFKALLDALINLAFVSFLIFILKHRDLSEKQ
jgi:hypothetical protein